MSEAKGGPVWPMWLLIPLMLVGVGVGVYMTGHHEVQLYGGEAHQFKLVGCEEAAGVNCDVVNTSEWSELLGVPLFTWAIPAYLSIAILAAQALRGRREALGWVFLGGVGASAFSAFLYYISVTEIGSVCLWCMRLYAINGAILALGALAGGHRELGRLAAGLPVAAGAFVVLAALSIGGQRAYRASLLGDSATTALATGEGKAAALERDAAGVSLDPKGPAPELAIPVRTEDDNDRTLRTTADDPWKGRSDAKVTLVEFADLECGYCKRTSAELRRVMEAYGDDIVVVFKHFPMDPACNVGVKNKKHRNACKAAVASVCAQKQGRFWAFHDLAFKNQHQLSPAHLRTYAEKVGLDLAAYDACFADPATEQIVRADTEMGAEVDIHGTPRIFLNGQLYRSGTSAEQMARAIELALGRDSATASAAASKVRLDDRAVEPIPADVPAMREVKAGELHFFIDTFEAGLKEGAAVSGKHEIPATRMSWFAAKDACEASGKRMCSEAEWIAACQGAAPVDDDADGQFADDLIEGTAYPYGDYHEPGRCWDDRDSPEFRPVYTGEMPGCASRDGAYDLTGNVEEWVGVSPERAVLLGGAWDTDKDHARCYRRNDTFGAGYANKRTGFRCCKNAP